MSKPPGIGIVMSDGVPVYRVTPIDHAADKVWDCVRDCICAGMSPETFRREAAEAWEHELREAGKDAARIIRGK